MFNVIIVEDDAIVRTYLSGLMDWDALGLKIVGEFENGQEAKDFIDKEKVDIVITDINMPVMNGIDLIKSIKSSGKLIKIIVLSCYNDYDFLREALKCGVSDYILKQYLAKDALEVLFTKLIEELCMENTMNRKYSDEVIKSNLLKNIISRIIICEEEATEQFPDLGYIFANSKYLMAIVKIDDYALLCESNDKNLLKSYKSKLQGIIETNMSKGFDGLTSITRDNEFTILLSFHSNQELGKIIEKISELIDLIRSEVNSELGLSISVAVSNVCSMVQQIPEAFKRAQSIIKGHMLFHKGKNIFLKDYKGYKTYALNHEEEKNLLSSIIEGDGSEAVMLMESYLNKFESVFDNVDSVEVCILDLVNILSRIAMQCGIEVKALFGNGKLPYEEIEEKCSIGEIRNWFISIVEKIMKLNNEMNNTHRNEVLKAVKYIESHYAEEISLRDVAMYVNISPNYFSMLFKKEVGVGFAEYLLNIRIEKAKGLLKKKDIKIYEVAFKAGFANNQYFNRVFKEKVGVTPLAYKKEGV